MPSVLSLNISGYDPKHGKWDVRREHIRAAIKFASPDVVLLQSVAYDRAFSPKNQAEQLADLLPDYPFNHYMPASPTEVKITEGLGIIAKMAPDDVFLVRLGNRPKSADPTPRMVLHAPFRFGGGTLHLLNVQWSPVYEQGADNIAETLAYADAISEPILLMGDVNRPGDSPLLAHLRESGWTDAWATLYPNDGGCTFEADHPTVRRTQAWAKNVDITKAKTIMNETNAGRMSAHLGLLVGYKD